MFNTALQLDEMNDFTDQLDSNDLTYKFEIECEDGTLAISSNRILSQIPDECEYEVIHEEHMLEEEQDEEPQVKKLKAKSDDLKRRSYIPKYRKEWENIPAYRQWLSESVLGIQYFYCKFCKNDNKCGRTDIEKHMMSKKHLRNSNKPPLRVQRNFSFRGLLCPVFTPFAHKEVNYHLILPYAKFLATCGIKGVLINDIIGEGMTLTINERMRLTEEWACACEKTKQHLMVQVGGACLRDIQEMARHAEKKKVGSILLLPDLYNKPKDHLDLMRYIKSVSEFATSIPILYHHNPKYTNVRFDMTKFLNDIIGEINSFVGIIFADNDLGEALSALDVNREKFSIFLGTDEIILGGATNGFSSLLSSTLNFFPKISQTIYLSVKEGNLKEARRAQMALKTTLDTIGRHGDMLPVLKAAMNLLSPINVGTVREPLVGLWQDKINKMRAELQQLGVGVWLSSPKYASFVE